MLKYVFERLKKVLKDSFVKDNFVSMFLVGSGLLVAGVLGRAIIQFTGIEHLVAEALVCIIAIGGVTTFLFGTFGILVAFFTYKK